MRNVSEQPTILCLLTACLSLACEGTSFASPGPLLYATDSFTRGLYTLCTTNGSPSLVGTIGLTDAYADLAHDSGNDTLYMTTTVTDCLYALNSVDGTARLIGPLGVTLMHGLAYDNANRVLYGAPDPIPHSTESAQRQATPHWLEISVHFFQIRQTP